MGAKLIWLRYEVRSTTGHIPTHAHLKHKMNPTRIPKFSSMPGIFVGDGPAFSLIDLMRASMCTTLADVGCQIILARVFVRSTTSAFADEKSPRGHEIILRFSYAHL